MHVVNAFNLSSGGGYSILINFYKYAPLDSIFIVKSKEILDKIQCEVPNGPVAIVVPWWSRNPIGYLFFLFYWIDSLCKKNNANLISLGNISARTTVNQILYLHWPYFVYGLSSGTNSTLLVTLKRSLRYFLIRIFICYSKNIVVQTKTVKKHLLKRHNLKGNVFVVYPGYESFNGMVVSKPDMTHVINNDRFSLLYPSLYYSHKNFEIIPVLASEFFSRKLNYHFYVTLPDHDFSRIFGNSFENVTNLGILSKSELYDFYMGVDALFMPTKLETFGLPYIESLSFGLPILTSDLDFSREICGDYAYYFDPNSLSSIIESINTLQGDIKRNRDFLSESKFQLSFFYDWSVSVNKVFSLR